MPREVFPPAAQRPLNTTIMIVEDDEEVGHFLQQLIEEDTPYDTVLIENGRTALEKAPQIHPCLMLLDYRLPDINGLEVYDQLQARGETRSMSTIMMSATLPVVELEKRNIYQLKKPMDIGSVIRMITHALASYEENQLQEQH